MKEYRVRTCTLEDLLKLRQISVETFLETFEGENTPEDMEKYVEENLSLERLSQELSLEDSVFLLVEKEDEVPAYMKLNFEKAQTEPGHHGSLEIQRIYVKEQYKNLKIGQLLMKKAIELGRERSLDYIWLGVWEKNHKAIRFYEKLGFVKFDTHVFVLGDDAQTDHLMKLAL